METGIKGRKEIVVAPEQSARHAGSGLVDVFATPAMVALMEGTASDSVLPYLEEGQGTVGIALNITHDAATPIGMKVWCESELIKVEGRKLTFKVEVFDEKERVGGGTHERFIITTEKFQARVNAK
ncbi:MAG: thioesterase family protein [Lachnospiraceae bacterium]|nr:thioesterase family protein [Lachnospiraceae bacterium]MBR6350063.1 thioesterase family protein [Lachnospiraceae bacterium]